MGSIEEAATKYESHATLPHRFGKQIESLISSLLSQKKMTVLAVTHRVKSEDSAIKKMQADPAKYGTISDLHDVLGVRVIAYLASDVDKIVATLSSEFIIDDAKSSNKNEVLNSDQFGYLSHHLVAKISKDRGKLAEWSDFSDFYLEIQIRSVLQHAWAEIEHDLGYKPTSVIPAQMRRRFARLAGLLELADDEFDWLSTSARKHANTVSEQIALGNNAEVDRDSVSALIGADDVISRADREIAIRIGATLKFDKMKMYADVRATELRSIGFNDTDSISVEVARIFNPLISFASAWLRERADGEFDLVQEFSTVPTGISLFYLYIHRLILSGNYAELQTIGRLSDPDRFESLMQTHREFFPVSP